jgi:hypothetical protein
MEKKEFIEYCAQQLSQVFTATKQGKLNLKLKHQTEGLLRAGELLDIISREQSAVIIEKTHVDVFGVTPIERAERKKSLQDIKEFSSNDFFDIPAIQRRK